MNGAAQIRAIHSELMKRFPNSTTTPPALRELALDIHQALADSAMSCSIQAGVDIIAGGKP